MDEHTPGPWTVTPDGFRVWSETAQRVVAYTALNNKSRTFEAALNARLLAAAPDLLAACKAAFDLHSDMRADARMSEVDILICAAIAKAEGGENV